MILADDATRSAWAEALRVSPVLCHLGEAQLQRLIDEGDFHEFETGVEFIRAGTHTFSVYFVVGGSYDVERADETIRVEAPALLGEIAALTGTARTATVRAVGRVSTIVIERDRFLAAIRTSAAAGQALTELVADRLCAPDSIRQVGRFIVECIIGEGGSGRVLRARHPLLDIPVALKMLSHARALLPEGPHEFIREASLLFHLDHPGIVRVLDAFEAHRTFFIVMPWIEGETLREHIDRHADVSRGQILCIADEVLDALTALHAAGLVHRDIKPSNLLVRTSGKIVLIDLGIACERGATGSARRLVGSPTYCSPEQILGRPVDGRSDVYSLGCMLYELVFGKPPFAGNDVDSVINGHLRGTPDFGRVPQVEMGEPFLRWLRECLSRTRMQRPDALNARARLHRVMDDATSPEVKAGAFPSRLERPAVSSA
jgi:serine/threonine-protein kinase